MRTPGTACIIWPNGTPTAVQAFKVELSNPAPRREEG